MRERLALAAVVLGVLAGAVSLFLVRGSATELSLRWQVLREAQPDLPWARIPQRALIRYCNAGDGRACSDLGVLLDALQERHEADPAQREPARELVAELFARACAAGQSAACDLAQGRLRGHYRLADDLLERHPELASFRPADRYRRLPPATRAELDAALLEVARRGPSGPRVELQREAGGDALREVAVPASPWPVAELLRAGADPDSRHRGGASALLIAVRHERVEEALALIRAGADVNLPDAQGATPLLAATARRGPRELVAALLDAGARTDRRDEKGRTALMRAALALDLDAVDLLLRAGADRDATTPRGNSVLDLIAATRDGWTLSPEELGVLDQIDARIRRAAPPTI